MQACREPENLSQRTVLTPTLQQGTSPQHDEAASAVSTNAICARLHDAYGDGSTLAAIFSDGLIAANSMFPQRSLSRCYATHTIQRPAASCGPLPASSFSNSGLKGANVAETRAISSVANAGGASSFNDRLSVR